MRRRLVATLTASALAIGVIAAPVAARQPGPTIVDVAVAVNADGPYAGQFDILIAALGAADPAILATLGGNGQFTVFAPTDGAFVELLGILDLSAGELLANKPLLNAVLLYHVARGERDSADVLGSSRIRTLNGAFIRQAGGELIDGSSATGNAGFVVTDVQAANGIIHAIDAVLVP